MQLVGEKEGVAPEGKPEKTEKDTDLTVANGERVAVMELVTEPPCITDLFPPLESEKSKGNVTVKVKLVSLVKPPAAPRAVMVEVPVGVLARVLIVRVLVQVGSQEIGEKEAVELAGRPETTEKDTDWALVV